MGLRADHEAKDHAFGDILLEASIRRSYRLELRNAPHAGSDRE